MTFEPFNTLVSQLLSYSSCPELSPCKIYNSILSLDISLPIYSPESLPIFFFCKTTKHVLENVMYESQMTSHISRVPLTGVKHKAPTSTISSRECCLLPFTTRSNTTLRRTRRRAVRLSGQHFLSCPVGRSAWGGGTGAGGDMFMGQTAVTSRP